MPVVMETVQGIRLDVNSEYHAKRRKNVYAATWPGQRLDKEEFALLREIMEAGGGWYGRAYKPESVPCHFLFLKRKCAEETATQAQLAFAADSNDFATEGAPF